MRIASHLEKFDRLADLRDRLDPLEDFELWYWTTLTASTNAYNASLHLAGLTDDDSVFSTVPGVHLVRQADGGYARELRGPGDVSHVGWPSIPGPIPEDIRCMEYLIEAIEEYSDPCLRGDSELTLQIIAECERAFAEIATTLANRAAPAIPNDRAAVGS